MTTDDSRSASNSGCGCCAYPDDVLGFQSGMCTRCTHPFGDHQWPQPTPSTDPIEAAVDLLFAMRHHLPPDVMRTLADTWTCASAARHGEPAERFWEADDVRDPFADHDTDQCETENQVPAPTDDTAPGLTRVLLHLEKARDDAERDDEGNKREAFDEAIDYVRDELSRGPSGPLTREDNEWCVFYGGPDPDACAGREVTGQGEAEEASQWLIESGVAVRRVYRSPWQVRRQCASCKAVLDGQNDCCDDRIAEASHQGGGKR